MSYERLTAENAAVLFVDHQTGLANGVQTQTPAEFINNVKALVTIAQIYKLPAIVTTSAADGPNGPVLPVVASSGRKRSHACTASHQARAQAAPRHQPARTSDGQWTPK